MDVLRFARNDVKRSTEHDPFATIEKKTNGPDSNVLSFLATPSAQLARRLVSAEEPCLPARPDINGRVIASPAQKF